MSQATGQCSGATIAPAVPAAYLCGKVLEHAILADAVLEAELRGTRGQSP
jgi:hypothetical protein